MNIIHYTLGLPPYARGGLTKYAIDLCAVQKDLGHNIIVLWPGRISFNQRQKIVLSTDDTNIKNYEIINPLPLPQIYGIRDFKDFTRLGSKKVYYEFLDNIKPDIIHLHTLMGLHLEFIDAAKELGIKIVFTSHDFFGICPKSTLFYNGKTCSNNIDSVGCWNCSKFALSKKKMVVLQSPYYRFLKNSLLFQKLRLYQKNKRLVIAESDGKLELEEDLVYREKYNKLRFFYLDMFASIDIIHFNSSLTKDIYMNFFEPKNSKVINISHSEIANNWIRKESIEKVKFTYVGAIAEYKGFYLLLKVLDKVYQDGIINFELNLYSDVFIERPYLKLHKPYRYEELESVMRNSDVMVVPQEVTFGFTVLESLSYGCPVLVGENVGAKDLIIDGVTGWIIDYTEDAFYECIKKIVLKPQFIKEMNESIHNLFVAKTMENHNDEIMKLIYE